MTDLGDRVLVLIVVATGMAGLFGWGTAMLVDLDGVERYLVHAGLIVVYFVILLGVWETLQRIDTQAEEAG